jgi:hypothetical protein
MTETLILPGVVPVVGVTVSHVADGVTVYVRGEPLLVIETVCAAGAVPALIE